MLLNLTLFFKCHRRVLDLEWNGSHYSNCVTFMLFYFFLLSFPRNSIVINSDLITMCHTMAAVRSLQNDLSAGESTNTQSANVSKWKQFDSHWWPTEITTRIICHYFCTCAWDSCQPVCILNGGCTLPPLSILIEVKSKAEICSCCIYWLVKSCFPTCFVCYPFQQTYGVIALGAIK